MGLSLWFGRRVTGIYTRYDMLLRPSLSPPRDFSTTMDWTPLYSCTPVLDGRFTNAVAALLGTLGQAWDRNSHFLLSQTVPQLAYTIYSARFLTDFCNIAFPIPTYMTTWDNVPYLNEEVSWTLLVCWISQSILGETDFVLGWARTLPYRTYLSIFFTSGL